MRDAVVPAMQALREAGDPIELLVPHELWPLPTYREMLTTARSVERPAIAGDLARGRQPEDASVVP
jgi:hypothetical protein